MAGPPGDTMSDDVTYCHDCDWQPTTDELTVAREQCREHAMTERHTVSLIVEGCWCGADRAAIRSNR